LLNQKWLFQDRPLLSTLAYAYSLIHSYSTINQETKPNGWSLSRQTVTGRSLCEVPGHCNRVSSILAFESGECSLEWKEWPGRLAPL
jgi:hypothetical protein